MGFKLKSRAAKAKQCHALLVDLTTEKHGFSALNFIVSGILPYADWSTKVGAGYGSKYEIPAFLMSSSLSLALDY